MNGGVFFFSWLVVAVKLVFVVEAKKLSCKMRL